MYIAIDVGATHIRIASSKSLEVVSLEKRERFLTSGNFETDFSAISKGIRSLTQDVIESIGIGTPGTYDEKTHTLISAKNLVDWVGKSLAERLSVAFCCPVFIENDAVVASFGEAMYGYQREQSILYFTWGTGIGAAHVVRKGGKVTSTKVLWGAYLKGIEMQCGGKALSQRFGKSIDAFQEGEWSQVLDDFKHFFLTMSEKFQEKYIVLGGGMTAREKHRLQPVIDYLKNKGVNLQLSSFDDDGGVYGGFALIQIEQSNKE